MMEIIIIIVICYSTSTVYKCSISMVLLKPNICQGISVINVQKITHNSNITSNMW